jgi:hypothetical protein
MAGPDARDRELSSRYLASSSILRERWAARAREALAFREEPELDCADDIGGDRLVGRRARGIHHARLGDLVLTGDQAAGYTVISTPAR